jgi:hypothetical protein
MSKKRLAFFEMLDGPIEMDPHLRIAVLGRIQNVLFLFHLRADPIIPTTTMLMCAQLLQIPVVLLHQGIRGSMIGRETETEIAIAIGIETGNVKGTATDVQTPGSVMIVSAGSQTFENHSPNATTSHVTMTKHHVVTISSPSQTN